MRKNKKKINPMKIYIAAPLFNEMERSRNLRVDFILSSLGHKTYLPQKDAGNAYEIITENKKMENKVRKDLFKKDINALNWCDVILCLFDGRVPDEGTIFELGYCYAKKKLCFGLKTDNRAMDNRGRDNIMIEHGISRLFRSENDLQIFMKTLKK